MKEWDKPSDYRNLVIVQPGGICQLGGIAVGQITNQRFGDLRAQGSIVVNNQINSAGAQIINDVRSAALAGISTEAKEAVEELAREIGVSPDLTDNEKKKSIDLLQSVIDMLKKESEQRDKGAIQSALDKIKKIAKRAKPVLVLAVKVATIIASLL